MITNQQSHSSMIASIVLTAVIIIASLALVLVSFPKGISVDKDNNLKLSTVLGKPMRIPVDSIEMIEMPEGLLSHLIRTNGMSMGKYDYGHYKNTKTGQKMFLYLTGKPEKVCFKYEGQLFVVDDWRQ